MSAWYARFDSDFVAGFEVLDGRSNLYDCTGGLVTEHNGTGEDEVTDSTSLPIMNIGAAQGRRKYVDMDMIEDLETTKSNHTYPHIPVCPTCTVTSYESVILGPGMSSKATSLTARRTKDGLELLSVLVCAISFASPIEPVDGYVENDAQVEDYWNSDICER